MSPLLGIVLTMLFLATGSYSAIRLAISSAAGPVDRTAEFSHLLMSLVSLAMIAMAWDWSSSAGNVIQIVVFGVYGVYFLVRMARRSGHDRVASGYQSLMSAAMVVMVVTMPVVMAAPVSSHTMGGMGGMGGMDMGSSAPAWTGAVSLAFAGALVVAASWWVSDAIRASSPTAVREAVGVAGDHSPASPTLRLSPRNDALCHTLMCVGMVVMLFSML